MIKPAPFIIYFCLLFLSQPGWAQDFVGSDACASCHESAYDNWQRSHHKQAMQLASPESVLGDFNNAGFDYFGQTSRFYQRDGSYFVETDNAEGELQEFRVAYTFGFYPLQQYLLEFPDGRLQALSISWDSRTAEEGGQRWYHLYPDEEIIADDMLHWTGAFQNWNSRCASCHTTDFEKNYDSQTNTYSPQWSEAHVGCEACHGPGSQHLDWANGDTALSNLGLEINIDKVWEPVAGQLAIPENNEAVFSQQFEVCASCHSRRAELQKRDVAAAFLNNYSLTPLLGGLYFPDGQILDEVYVAGSFLQSKMHQNQVSCTNCHEPHTNQLRIEGNGLCLQCHAGETFQNETHLLHEPGTSGAQCVNCHMPERTFMGVDARRDHSFRIPDPIASLELGVPNACNQCHQDESVQWAVDSVSERTGRTESVYPHAAVIAAARENDSEIVPELLALARDETRPAMIRGSAFIETARFPSQRNIAPILNALNSDDELLRLNAVHGLGFLSPQQRVQYLQDLLNDPVKAVRMNVARLLIGLTVNEVPPRYRNDFSALQAEYVESLLFNADMPESMNELGSFHAAYGDLQAAATAFEQARLLAPQYLPAMLNLADVYRARDRDDLAEEILDEALAGNPDSADALFSLGLLYVRTFRLPESLALFQRASTLSPDNPQYIYLYGVALAELDRVEEAIEILVKAQQRFPTDAQIRNALQAYRAAL